MEFNDIVHMSDRELEQYVRDYYSSLDEGQYKIENPSLQMLVGKDGFINYQIEVYKSYRDSFKS